MEVITYKCPNCGGDLTFDPASGKYKCEYCLSSFTQEEAEKANPKAAEALNGEDDAAGAQEASDAQKESSTEETKGETEQGEAVVYTCPNCGAEIVTDATTAATYCFYCHNPVVLSGRLSGEYMPDFVLPFKISKEQAIEKFLSFARKKRFIPKDFFEKNQVQKMTGVYFPYWIYGGDFETDYIARGRKVRVWQTGDVEYTETSIYDVRREGEVRVDGLSRNALNKADRDLIECVQPYRLEEMQPFSMGYLSGFQAEKRDIEQAQIAPELKKELETMARGAMRNEANEYLSLEQEKMKLSPKRAGAGARVYSLDETGELGKFLEENQSSGVSLSAENLADLKKQLSSFCLSYNDQRFESVYDAKYSLQASVAEYMNFNALGDMDAQLQAQGINYKQISAPQPGIISYMTDSFEGVAPEEVTADSFDWSQYTRQVGRAGELIEAGTPVYKIITSENWSIVFQMDDKDKEQFADQDTLTIEPLGSDMKFRGNYSMFTGSDGNLYGRLDLDRYMIQFESERFMTFEISSEETQGLKIPVSSVMEKEFYTIPVDYMTTGGNATEDEAGFNKEVYGEGGKASIEFVTPEIYSSTDEYYYVEKSDDGLLKSGDYLVKPDSNERFQVGPTAKLTGAYNINKGYAVFKQVKELANSGEYYIVEKGTKYGLSVYDHIVLDASTVSDGQIVYQ
mgnify:CR=1 FL=1